MNPIAPWVLWLVRSEVFLAAVAGLTFVIVYHWRWRWWRSSIGRMLMSFMGGLESIVLLTVVGIFWPRMPGRIWLSVGAWGLLAFLFTWKTVVLISIKRSHPITVQEIDKEIQRLVEAKLRLLDQIQPSVQP